MATHTRYYDISLDDQWTCGWCGRTFRIGDEFETYDDLYDVHCPGCERMVLIVSFRTPEETRQAAAAGNREAIRSLPQAERIEQRWRRIEELELRSVDELPEIPGDDGPPKLVFDLVEDEGPDDPDESWFVVRHGDRVWRELAIYDGAPRYATLRDLLLERYGPGTEIDVTGAASFYLLGDKYTSLAGEER